MRAFEALDADGVASFFASGAVFRLEGVVPMAGRTAIRKALVQFFLSVDLIREEEIASWSSRDYFVMDTDVTLTLAGGTTLAFPVTCTMRWRDGLIQEAAVQMYLESRLALAMARFDRIRGAAHALRKLA